MAPRVKAFARGSGRHAGRWVVSYADLVTLLFSLFAMLYAISIVDRERLADVAEGVRAAFQLGGIAEPLRLGGQPRSTPLAREPVDLHFARLQRELERRLAAEIAGHEVAVSLATQGLRVRIGGGAGGVFVGESQLADRSRSQLREIGEALRGHLGPLHIEVLGPSLALASSRAVSASQTLMADSGLPATQLVVVGRAAAAGASALELWLPAEARAAGAGDPEALRQLLDRLPDPPEAEPQSEVLGSGIGSRVE